MSDLSSLLSTTVDRTSLIGELDIIKRSFFSSSPTTDLGALGIRANTMQFWSTFVTQTDTDLKQAIENLRQEILGYTIIHVSLPFEPEVHFVAQLITLFRTQLGEQYILEIAVQANLGVGMIYTLKGKVIDRSLGTKMKEIDIPAIIRTHLPVLSS